MTTLNEMPEAPSLKRRTAPMLVRDVMRTEDGIHEVTIYSGNEDDVRSPYKVDPNGGLFTNYLKNPVVMYNHDTVGHSGSAGLPIGRTTELRRSDDDGLVRAVFQFAKDDPFAARVENLWDQGILRAASMSWMPMKSEARSADDGGGWLDTEWDLLEWSIVAIPADPHALREAYSRMVRTSLEEAPAPNDPTTGERIRQVMAEVQNESGWTRAGDIVRDMREYLKQRR
jgi:HK97 family phage prohead protease